MGYFFGILLIVFAFAAFIYRRNLWLRNNMEEDKDHFKQADVEVIYSTGTISIKGHQYNVSQVTGITTENYGKTIYRNDNGREGRTVIDVDDLKMPRHSIVFSSVDKASIFTQRLCTALRKANGPSFK